MFIQIVFRYLLMLTFAFTMVSQVQAQNHFIIDGQIGRNIQGKIILQYYSHPNKFVKDSSDVVNGKFNFTGEIGDPYYANMLFIRPGGTQMTTKPIDYKPFFLEGAQIKITGTDSLNNATIVGGKAQADYLERGLLLKNLNDRYKPLAEQQAKFRMEGKAEAAAELQKEITLIMESLDKIDSTWISQHPKSYAAFMLWSKKIRGDLKEKDLAEFKRFSPEVRSSEQGNLLAQKIAIQQKLALGKSAPDILGRDTLGNVNKLSSQKGNYVLLMFYNTENVAPQMIDGLAYNLRKVSKRLKDKNFVIYGVNYDSAESWKKFIQSTSFNWVHVSDAGGFDKDGPISEIAKQYGLSRKTVPQSFLLDPEGKIILRRVAITNSELGLELEKIVK